MYPYQFYGGQQITRVNGENGARALNMQPNSSMLALDENEPILWLAQTDGAGYKTVTPYQITPFERPKPVDLSSIEERLKKLEEKLYESDPAETKSKQPGK